MVTVKNEEELKAAFRNKESKIIVIGPLAEKMIKRAKTKKAMKIAGIALTVASLAAVPFTFGASAAGAAAGAAMCATAVAATGLTITMSALELAILCGAALGAYGIYKGSKVTFSVNEDGPNVVIEPKYKEAQ